MSAVPSVPALPAAGRLPAEVLRELTAQRTPADRLRARATTAAAAGIGSVLLVAVAIAGIPDLVRPGMQLTAAQEDLSEFLRQSGLRPGTVVGALLLVLPFAALAVQALRVGSLALQRQAGLLALAGATPADLRRVRVARTRAAFLRGGLVAAPVYALLHLALGVALPPGSRLLPTPQWWLPLAWVGVVALLVGGGSLLGLRPPRAGQDDDGTVSAALSRQDLVAGGTPSLRWAAASGSAAVLVAVLGVSVVSSPSAPLPVFLAVLCLAVLLAALCAALLIARAAAGPQAVRRRRVRGVRRGGRGDAAVHVLASAQRRSDPLAAGTVGGVLFICGLSFGVEASLSAGLVAPAYGDGPAEIGFYLGGAALAAAVAVVGICVALLALALALTDHLLATRRAVAATAALGLEPRRLLLVQRRSLTRSAVPAVVAGTLLSGLLYSAGISSRYLEQPWVPYLVVVVAAAGAGLLVALACRLVVALLAGRVRAAAALENLRTP